VLVKVAAPEDTDELDAPTDSQHRQAGLLGFGEQPDFGRIAVGAAHPSLGMLRPAVSLGFDVGAAGEDETVERGNRLRRAVEYRRQQDGTSSCAGHGLDVDSGQQSRAPFPRSPPGQFQVATDADDGDVPGISLIVAYL
jgi:hypothetical protein